MGTLYHGAARTPIKVDDRLLAHVKVLIVSKLRRNEPFLLSWTEPASAGHGGASVWIHPDVDLIFRFEDPKPPDLEKAVLEALSTESIGATGAHIEASLGSIWRN
jgi:hypothetical protein